MNGDRIPLKCISNLRVYDDDCQLTILLLHSKSRLDNLTQSLLRLGGFFLRHSLAPILSYTKTIKN